MGDGSEELEGAAAVEDDGPEACRQRVRTARLGLPARRRSFHPDDPAARSYLQALDEAVLLLRQQGEVEEACRFALERVKAGPTPDAHMQCGELLQMCGRTGEALEQYRRAPYRLASRYFHAASIHHQEGRWEEALTDVLRGLARDRWVGAGVQHVVAGKLPWWPGARSYWERYGHLWSPEAKRFLQAVYAQGIVRTRLTDAGHLRVLKRALVDEELRPRLWKKIREHLAT